LQVAHWALFKTVWVVENLQDKLGISGLDQPAGLRVVDNLQDKLGISGLDQPAGLHRSANVDRFDQLLIHKIDCLYLLVGVSEKVG